MPTVNFDDAHSSYVELLQFVIHRLNISFHCPLDRLSRYADISLSRLDESRKKRTDRRQVELTHAEHVRLAATCFEIGASELGLALLRWQVDQYVQVMEREFDRKQVRVELQETITRLRTIQEKL